MSLHERARALLALREKATPGPWVEQGQQQRYAISGCYDGKTHAPRIVPGDLDLGQHGISTRADAEFIAAAHDMADTIAELLAENERLNGVVQTQHETMMEAIARTNAAEAQLRELAGEKPVMWTTPDFAGAANDYHPLRPIPLIRRPEMP